MYIVADIGGTNMRLAGSRDFERFDEPVILSTPQKYTEGLAVFVDNIKKVAGNEMIDGVAIGIAALLGKDQRSIAAPVTNIPDWGNRPFADDLEQRLGARVHLINDVAQVGLGEGTFGAGLGAHILMYMTISTGVNGVRIVDGRVDPVTFGFSTGYQYLFLENEPRRWSDLISGRAISEKYGKHPRELGKDNPLWEELARITAFGIHNSILHWSPERVVLGGSMFNDIGIPIDRVRYHVQQIMKALPEVPEIVHASLGDVGGLWGGLVRLKQIV